MKSNNFTRSLLIIILLLSISLPAQEKYQLPRSTPEKEGVSSKGILNFLDAVSKSSHEFHSFMFLRHGRVIAEGWWKPYAPELKHTMYSVSKSFTSTAVGFAVTEKKLSLNDRVISFFPDKLPDTVSPNLSQMRVVDLLTMTAGQDPDPTFLRAQEYDWIKAFLSVPVINKPGSKFLYNSMATFMLSAIVQKVTGEKVIDYLTPRLFTPLGITGIDWEESPTGINSGGWGLRLKTEDMARFGQLYLQKGQWNGRQIIPENWIEEATTKKIDQNPLARPGEKDSSDWLQGYCYKFWRCRHNAFRADGAYGQFIIVMPEQDAVVAFTSESSNLQGEVNLVWDYLLPAIQNDEIPAENAVQSALHERLNSLTLLQAPVCSDNSPVSLLSGKTVSFEPNVRDIKSISLNFRDGICSMNIISGNGGYEVLSGENKWVTCETKKPGPALFRNIKGTVFTSFKVAGSFKPEDSTSLEFKFRYIESPHSETMVFHINKDQVSLDIRNSNDPSSKKVTLLGRLQ